MTTIVPLYKKDNAWVFDDNEKGIKAEPFVRGSSEIIDEAASIVLLSGKPTELVFSDTEELMLEMDLIDIDGDWSKYYSEELDMEGWLCPVLYEYFSYPPEKLYFTLY
jgi:hypothetical protein